jgi:hypothetical protein
MAKVRGRDIDNPNKKPLRDYVEDAARGYHRERKKAGVAAHEPMVERASDGGYRIKEKFGQGCEGKE